MGATNTIFETPLYPYSRSKDQSADHAVRHPVVIIGAGPVGLTAAVDLALQNVPVVLIDDNDKVSFGSRAICFSKRTLDILDRLGCADAVVKKGVVWDSGKVFFDTRQIYQFNLQPEAGHKHPAFINLQQYYLEKYLVDRIRQLQAQGKSIDLRGKNRLTGIAQHIDHVTLDIDTPDGPYRLSADWVIAADGANSATRTLLGLDFEGRVFEDNFLIADVVMQADFPTERWFWFDPPFNRGQSALLHKQPDNVWRIDLQLGWDIDKEHEKKPENVIPRLKAMLGEDVKFDLEWVSIYTFQCRRMEKFRHARVLFAGDSAHQVSPFGARGANSGVQDAENLCWKLKLVIDGHAPDSLLDTYSSERVQAAEENVLISTRSTEFITPKSDISRAFRNAVLDLAEDHAFARPLVNSGRLSLPCIYKNPQQSGADDTGLPAGACIGAPARDAPVNGGWLLDRLGSRFQLLVVNVDPPKDLQVGGITVNVISLTTALTPELKARYLGDAKTAVYLLRPDQHIVARWLTFDGAAVKAAVLGAIEKENREAP